MKLKSFKPTSPGVRHKIVIQKNLLAKDSSLIKNLIKPATKNRKPNVKGKNTFQPITIN